MGNTFTWGSIQGLRPFLTSLLNEPPILLLLSSGLSVPCCPKLSPELLPCSGIIIYYLAPFSPWKSPGHWRIICGMNEYMIFELLTATVVPLGEGEKVVENLGTMISGAIGENRKN